MKPLCSTASLLVLILVAAPDAAALPAMIRLGYNNCAACHISPQGGGLLNLYGRGIDQAQSLVGGEYQPWRSKVIRELNWEGRVTQDFRVVMQQQDVSTTDRPGTQALRSRFIYRNATELGGGWRFTGTVTGENESALRPKLFYAPPATAEQVFVNTALISYRHGQTLEFAAGRDQLPTGVNIPDLSYFIRSRNRIGYYDSPTQVKMFWWGKRYLVTPYAYGPGGNEASGDHEHGGGALAEVDVFGKQRTVFGLNLLHGATAKFDRTLIGPYARVGFGKWGILAEYDVTAHNSKTGAFVPFRQSTGFGQVFWAAREWLVASATAERLRVDRPFEENLKVARLDLTARLSSQVTWPWAPGSSAMRSREGYLNRSFFNWPRRRCIKNRNGARCRTVVP